MTRRYSTQITAPKNAGPVIAPLARNAPSSNSARTITAITTGAPTTSPMKIVRRDHSISPTDRSKMRSADVRYPGALGIPVSNYQPPTFRLRASRYGGRASLHQILEDRLQIVVRRRHFVDGPEVAARGHLGEPRVERVGLLRFHDNGARLEPEAQHIVALEELPREPARLVRADVDGVRVLVDELPDLMDVAFGEDPAVVDQQDVRRHRLDLVQDMARNDDALAGAAPLADQANGLAAAQRIHAGKRLVENEELWIVHERLRHLHALAHP